MIRFSQLESITGGKNIRFSSDMPVSIISLDSRKASAAEGTVFFAIRGERHDGHDYLQNLYAQGIRQFVVERPLSSPEIFKDANVILVDSAIDALQRMAAFHRSTFSVPVVGITGSNGKTIIKEWLFQMLSKDRVVVKNPGSYNSQVGVPLSVWQMQPHHQLGIFEAGISRPGEMEKIAQVMQPTIGIFTNIGSAHDEGFKDRDEKIHEKLKLFDHAQTVIYCHDHKALHDIFLKRGLPSFSWGASPESDLQVTPHDNAWAIRYKQQTEILRLPFTDTASVENCLHCVALLLTMGYSFSFIRESVQSLRGVPMRMELKEGMYQSQIIDDTYNNDLGVWRSRCNFWRISIRKKRNASSFPTFWNRGWRTKRW
jgi:alanine racemase